MKSADAAVDRTGAIPPFVVFAWLWAAGTLSHMASYSESLAPVTVAMVVLAFAILLGISRTAAFFALLVVHLFYVYERLPNVPNHSILAASIDLTILAAAASAALSKRHWKIDTAALYDAFAPVVRIELLVLYFFVVFHKLNTGFFDREDSCAVFMYLRLAGEYPILPVADWAKSCMIYITLFVEAAIPIMFVVRRLRIAGLLLAFAFHFALAMDPDDVVFNFSAMLLALFFLFVPKDLSAALSSTLAPLRRRWARARVPGVLWAAGRAALYLGVPALIVLIIFRFDIHTGLTYRAARHVWVLYSGFVLSVFLATWLRNRGTPESARRLLAVPSPALLMFPALLVFNGMLPYLGGKTETSFAMFSNLRTEGGVSNHWLVPASVQIWKYQYDFVKVQRTSVPRIRRIASRGFQWTYFEFRWLMSGHPDASVTYERNGVVTRLRRVKDDPSLMNPEGGAWRKLLKFRPVSIDPTRSPCIH